MDILGKQKFEKNMRRNILQEDVKLPKEIAEIVPIILDVDVSMKQRAVYATRMIDWIRYMDTVIWQFDEDFTKWKEELYETGFDN